MRRTLAHLREVGVTDVTVVLGQHGDKVKARLRGRSGHRAAHRLRRAGTAGRHRRRHPAARAAASSRVSTSSWSTATSSPRRIPFHQAPAIVQLLQGTDRRRLSARPADRALRQRLPERHAHHARSSRSRRRPASATTCWPACSSCRRRCSRLLEKSGGDMERVFDAADRRRPALNASIWEEGWIDVEYPWDILAANRMVMDTWEEAQISRHAVIEGNVTLQRAGAHRAGLDHQVGRRARRPLLHRAATATSATTSWCVRTRRSAPDR